MKKILCLLLAMLLFQSCGKSTEESKLNIYIDVKDKNTISVLKFLGDEYEKKNKGVKINYMIPMNEINKENKNVSDGNVIITNRPEMLNLSRDGALSDLSDTLDKLKIHKDYMNIISYYGRYNNVNYGIGFFPKNIKIIYDKTFWDENKLNEKNYLDTLKKALNISITSGKKIPVILDDDMEINNFIFSLIANQLIDTEDMNNTPYLSREEYSSMPFNKVFKEINTLKNSRILSSDVFYKGVEDDFKKLNSGSTPFIITSANYYINYKDIKYIISQTPIYYISSVIAVPVESRNNWEAASFIKFLYSEDTGKLLSGKELSSGNMKYDKETYNKVLPMFNLPSEFTKPLEIKVSSVIKGNYTGSEWSDILDIVYK